MTQHQRKGGVNRARQSVRAREFLCGHTGGTCPNKALLCPWIDPVPAFYNSISNFVIDVGWALRWHLLNYIDRVSVVTADLLIMRAEDAVSSPERDDDVAGL